MGPRVRFARWARARRVLAGAVGGLVLCAGPLAGQGPACSEQGVVSLEGLDRAACYVELGRLQEAAWIHQASGDRARGRELLAELEARMRAEPASVGVLSAEGVDNLMSTWLVRFPSGVRGVFKPAYRDPGCLRCTAQHERAAFLLDTLMHVGLTPLTIIRSIELPDGDVVQGSLMYFVDDARQSAVHFSPDGQPVESEEHKPDLLRLLDVFLGNGDRHQGNWLVRNTGEVVAIDHNRAFLHDQTTTRTHWRQQYCCIDDLEALAEYVRRFEETPVSAYGPEFRTLLAPDRLAAFEAARPEIIRALVGGAACEGRP